MEKRMTEMRKKKPHFIMLEKRILCVIIHGPSFHNNRQKQKPNEETKKLRYYTQVNKRERIIQISSRYLIRLP